MHSELSAISGEATTWLFNDALPLWSNIGRDSRIGGFVEKISLDGQPDAGRRRLRVSARQAYVFAEAGRLGWQGPWADNVRHAMLFLNEHGRRPDGALAAWISAEGKITDAGPDLYDQAFYLFALAQAYQTLGDQSYRTDALRLIAFMRQKFEKIPGARQASVPPARAQSTCPRATASAA